MADNAPKEAFVLYHYTPSVTAAVVFVVLFLGTTLFHIFQLFKNRTWYFTPFVLGGLFEAVGYIGRAISANQSPNWSLPPYILQSLLVLLAPTLFAASIYMVLGRIIRLTDGEEYSLIRAKWLTKVFVLGDVLSFLAQSAGGGMLAQGSTAEAQKTGSDTITGGLFIQVFFFGFFIIVSVIFHMRIAKRPTMKSLKLEVPWQRYLLIMYAASSLIMIRSIFRIAEYIQGNDGALLQTETYLYLFDATLMFLTMVLFNVFHPSQIITKKSLDINWSKNTPSGPYWQGENVGMVPLEAV